MRKFLLSIVIFPFLSFSQNIDLKMGLVAYYKFENNLDDVSMNSNHGIKSGGVEFINGKIGKCVQFAGCTNPGSIHIRNSTSLKFDDEFSISMWIKINSNKGMDGYGKCNILGGSHCIVAKDHDRSGFYINANITNDGFYTNFGNSSPNFGVSTENRINKDYINKWTHIIYIKSKNFMDLYIDGKFINRKELIGDFNVANSRDLYFGKYSDTWYPYNGCLDEVRIYNRKLNSKEINELYSKTNETNVYSESNFENVTYQDKQIKNEVRFNLFDEHINFSHYAYSEKTSNLFLLTEKGIIQYDLSNVYRKQSKQIDFLNNTDIDNRRNGIEVNSEGTKLAYIDKQNYIHIIDIASKKELFQKNLKKYSNQNGKNKTSLGNDFVFISENELIIGSNKAIGILNTDKEKFKNIKFNFYEDFPTSLFGKNYITKTTYNSDLKLFKLSDDLKTITATSTYTWEDWNFITENSKKITRKKDGKELSAYVDKNDLFKLDEKSIVSADSSKQIIFPDILNFKWINNYEQLIGFKKDGIVIYNYSNISIEIEKQYYLHALNTNTNIAYDGFLKIYPNSEYKDLCLQKLDEFYLAELDKVADVNRKIFSDESEVSTGLEKVLLTNTIRKIDDLYQYMSMYPNSKYNKEVLESINIAYEKEFNKIASQACCDNYEKYISDYPKSPFKQKVQNLANEIYKTEFDKVCATNTIENYNSYKNKYPKSKYISEANDRICLIENADKEEKELYDKSMQDGNYYALEQYINKYPNGKYINDVKAAKKVFDDRRTAIERGKNTKLWKLGNKVCLVQYDDIAVLCGTLDSWNEDKSMAKIKLQYGMWDKVDTKYNGDELVKDKYIWIKPSDGWHICADFEIDLLEEHSNMPGSSSNLTNASGSSGAAGKNCYWYETLTISNNDGSIIGSLFSSLTNINFNIKYQGVIEQEIGDNYKIIISDARVSLGSSASYNQIKYKDYANQEVSKNIGQTRVISKSNVKL